MNERLNQIDRFLAATPWANCPRAHLAGDASPRKYQRISPDPDGRRAVLMDADPATGLRIEPFMRITKTLADSGLSPPRIYASDPVTGLMVIEDLGDALFARVVKQSPDLEEPLYTAATDVLITLHTHPAPELDAYDNPLMANYAALAFSWYLRGATKQDQHAAASRFEEQFLDFLNTVVPAPSVLVQRDYHAENLIWLPDRSGVARVGLLDYQDAMLGHPAYDLMSLLTDARRDVPATLQEQMIAHYIDRTKTDPEAFRAAYDALALQRNLRILGGFSRLSLHFGKPHYIDLIPRVWNQIKRSLASPTCAPLAKTIFDHLPEPSPSLLQSLKNQCATVPHP